MDTVLLRIIGENEAEWLDGDEPQCGPLASAAAALGGRLAVLVPGRDVLLARVNIPSTRRAEIERALPYALEEWLIGPPEKQHFSWRHTDTGVATAVVERERLEDWLARLEAAGLTPEVLLPETLALPWRSDEWSLLLAGDDAWLRTGAASGQAFDRDLLPLMFNALWQEVPEAERPTRLRLWCVDGEAPVELPLSIETEPVPSTVTNLFEVPTPDLNLLTGPYTPRSRGAQRFGPWRAAVAALAIFLSSTVALHMAEAYRLSHEATALQGRIDNLFHQTVPGVTHIVNVRVQMQQVLDALSSGTGSDDVLALLGRSAAVLAHTPGLHIVELSYRDDKIRIDLSAPSIAVFETLKDALRRQGLGVELGSVSSQNGVSQGELTLQRGNA